MGIDGNVTLMRGKLEKAESSYRRGLGFMKEECPAVWPRFMGGFLPLPGFGEIW